MCARIESLRGRKPHIVGVQRIRNNQLVFISKSKPIRQIVGIAVGDVLESAFFGRDANCVFGAPASIPAFGAGTDDFSVQADCFAHVGPLLFFGEVFVLYPFQSVACDFPARFFHRRDLFGTAGKRRCDAEHRHREVPQHAMEPPEARSRPVFVDRLHVPVPLPGPLGGTYDLGQECFGSRIAVKQAVFSAFLVVQDNLDGYIRASGPVCCRGLGSIARHVARISIH